VPPASSGGDVSLPVFEFDSQQVFPDGSVDLVYRPAQ
jgi:hypothetical protein